MKHVTIFTDGACKGNPGPGGWAALLVHGDKEKEIVGHEENTTNNRMELKAAIMALRSLKTACRVDLYTDSSYVQKGMTEWLKGWKAKGFKKVANPDLWMELDAEASKHHVTWHWVRGHDGHPENERVDQLASDAATAVQKSVFISE